MMGELTFFLGIKVKQQSKGIFISQRKYIADMLKQLSFTDCKSTKNHMSPSMKISIDSISVYVNPILYREITRSLPYLTGRLLII